MGKKFGGIMTLCGVVMYRSGGFGREWCVLYTFIPGLEIVVKATGDWDAGAEIEYIGAPSTETSGFAAVVKGVDAKF